MVQTTNCIIILVSIPSLPKPPFLTAPKGFKHSYRFSPLRNTGYPMRKLTIHFGNRQNAKENCLSRSTILHRCYTKRNFQSKSQILPLPHFYIPQNPLNKNNQSLCCLVSGYGKIFLPQRCLFICLVGWREKERERVFSPTF